jgi:hypothetical protein
MADTLKAEEYRQLAKEARREAERSIRPDVQDGFLKIAAEYMRMAQAVLDNENPRFEPKLKGK